MVTFFPYLYSCRHSWCSNLGGINTKKSSRATLTLIRNFTKISSCQVNTTSRRRIKQLRISFGSIFLQDFLMKVAIARTTFIVAGGNPHPLVLNDSPANGKCWQNHNLVTMSVLKCNLSLLLKPLVTDSNSHFDICQQTDVLLASPVTSDLHCSPVTSHTLYGKHKFYTNPYTAECIW